MAVTISIGAFTFDGPGGPIVCHDWSDVLKGPSKRVSNRIVPSVTGRAVRERFIDETRAGLGVRIVADSHADVYVHLQTLREVATVNVPQTLTVDWGDGSASADCIVEEMGPPTFQSPKIVTLVLDLTLPDGPLDLEQTP